MTFLDDWSEPTRWMLEEPLLALWCRLRGHRPGAWGPTFQPHVQEQRCGRCGAVRHRHQLVA